MRWKLHPPGERGPCWYLRGSHRGRRFEVSTGATHREGAEIFAADYTREFLRDLLLERAPEGTAADAPVSYAAASAAYKAWRDPGKLDAAWIDKLAAWFGDKPVGAIVPADIHAAATALLPAASSATRNRQVVTPAAAVLHYAAEQKWCAWVRVKRFKVSRKSSRTPADEATMAALLGATEGRQRLLLAMLYETGLRISDLLRIDEPAMERAPAGRRVAAVLVKVGKTDDRIRIELSAALGWQVARSAREPDGRLFPWATRWGVYRWLKPLCVKLGVKYTPHQSRHALATELLRRRIPDKQAAEYGAWADHRSLHRYQHIAPEPLEGRSALALITGRNRRRG